MRPCSFKLAAGTLLLAVLSCAPKSSGNAQAPSKAANGSASADSSQKNGQPDAAPNAQEKTMRMEEKKLLDQLRNRVFRANDSSLTIILDNGSKIQFNDTLLHTDNDGQVGYFVTDYLPALSAIVIEREGWEWGDWLSVNMRNGKCDTLISRPTIGPGRNYLLCDYRDIEAGFMANGFQIWKISGDSLTKAFYSAPGKWGPDSAKWVDDSTISFERVEMAKDAFTSAHDTLSFRSGTWKYGHPIELDSATPENGAGE